MHSVIVCTSFVHLLEYVLKRVILWKQRLHRRTETRVQVFWARLASFGHLGLINFDLSGSFFQSKFELLRV